MKKLLLGICLFGFSVMALAEVSAADVRAVQNARNQACSSGSSRDCYAAMQQENKVSNQLHQEMGASMNRGEYGDQRRTRIQEEERWRQEVRNR